MKEDTMAKTVKEVYEVLKQISADSYDGSPLKIGLKREEADKFHNRVMDAFSISFKHPNLIRVKYSSQVKLADIHGNGAKNVDFEGDTYGMVDKVANFLKKEYKSRGNEVLKLKEVKKMQEDIDVQYVSRINTYCTVAKWYEITDEDGAEEKEASLNKNITDFISAFKKPARPKNDTRKNEE